MSKKLKLNNDFTGEYPVNLSNNGHLILLELVIRDTSSKSKKSLFELPLLLF